MLELKEGIVVADHYRLIRQLGTGSVGNVWLAHNLLADIDVAIKFYGAFDQKGIEEFRNEFKMAYRLNHPNLLNINHFDVWQQMPYLVMPYCQNGSATDLVGRLSERQVWTFVRDVSAGLAFLHAQTPPIVHQDIKPGNILILADGRYVITDFGISHKTRTLISTFTNESTPGTIAYMGPERFQLRQAIIMASDIWSLGMTICELILGFPLWEGMGGPAQIAGAQVPSLESKVSRELSTLVAECLALDAWRRPNALEIHNRAVSALGRTSSSQSLAGTQRSPMTSAQQMSRPSVGHPQNSGWPQANRSSKVLDTPKYTSRKRHKLLAAFGIIGLLTIGGLGYLFWDATREQRDYGNCHTKADYELFIERYPNSKYADFARRMVGKPEREAAIEEPVANSSTVVAIDTANINRNRGAADAVHVRTIYEDLPVHHAQKGKEKDGQQIGGRTNPDVSTQQEYSVGADDAMFSQCVTYGDFDRYLRKYPNGRHVQQARRAMNNFRESEIPRDNPRPNAYYNIGVH